MNKFKFDHYDIKAFSILGLEVGLKWEKVQGKFKKLVKKFHPDMNSDLRIMNKTNIKKITSGRID